MTHRSQAFKSVSEAICLDSSGNFELAYARYLQSLQQLCKILVDQYNFLGYSKLLENPEEAKQMLSLVGECSKRMDSILCSTDSVYLKESDTKNHSCEDLGISSPLISENSRSYSIFPCSSTPKKSVISPTEKRESEKPRFPVLNEAKRKNIMLLKLFQSRIENARDENVKSSLRLELHRRLAENMEIANLKQAELIRQEQREKQIIFKAAERELLSNQHYLSETDMEKRKTYVLILEYEANQVPSCTTNMIEPPVEDITSLFKRTFQCNNHPLAKWLFHIQTEIKCKIDNALAGCSMFIDCLPATTLDAAEKETITFENSPLACEIMINEGNVEALSFLPYTAENLSMSAEHLRTISSDIRTKIDDMLETFLHAYKTQLPSEHEFECYNLIESFFLQPLWTSLILLFRIVNLRSELRIAGVMMQHSNFCSNITFPLQFTDALDSAIFQAQSVPFTFSLVEKLSLLVQISKSLCGGTLAYENEDDIDLHGKIFGADELIPTLCTVVAKSKMPRLVSECHALEQLVHLKYMLGEEGYALTSFQTALKYIDTEKWFDKDEDE